MNARPLVVGLTSRLLRAYKSKGFQPQMFIGTTAVQKNAGDMYDPPSQEPPIPAYQERFDEPVNLKRARLLYQSRKRGMLENGLVLSTFAAKYLNKMEGETLNQYDRLINLPTNDWDIYYWATGVRSTPLEFNNQVMEMLKEHVKNKDRESRIRQPDLVFETA